MPSSSKNPDGSKRGFICHLSTVDDASYVDTVSKIVNSTIINSKIYNSRICNSTIQNCWIHSSTITTYYITNSLIYDSYLHNNDTKIFCVVGTSLLICCKSFTFNDCQILIHNSFLSKKTKDDMCIIGKTDSLLNKRYTLTIRDYKGF